MISTLTMHVQYGRSAANVSDNAKWRPPVGQRRVSEPWRSVWRSGYDGPWSSTSDRSGARNSLERANNPTRSRSSVEGGSSNSATERLRRLKLKAKGRYRRALNVSEASQPDSALFGPGGTALGLSRLDEIDDESVADEERPAIPYTTCPKSAPAILSSQRRSFPEPFTDYRMSLPPRSLSSQSYRGLPLYNTRKEIVADKIRSLGRILRQSDSSSQSTSVSELPTPLYGKQRRRQARATDGMHTDSVASSPLFNTPSSEIAMSPTDTTRRIFDSLVRAPTLLATAELDRLCFLANTRTTVSKTSETEPTAVNSGTTSSANVPPNTPATLVTPLDSISTVATSQPQTDGVPTPAAPANTPASDGGSPAVLIASRTSQYHSYRRREARSRLSEVQNQDDAPRDVLEESSTESGSVIAACRDQDRPLLSPAGKEGDMCEQHTVYHRLVPEPLSLAPSSTRQITGPTRKGHSRSSSSKSDRQNKLDMDHLNELLDNAITRSVATRRLDASESSQSRAGGTSGDTHVSHSKPSSPRRLFGHDTGGTRSLPLGSIGVRPFVNSRASSPGPRPALGIRDLSSLSAASPVVRKHIARHVSRTTTPAKPHEALNKPNARAPHSGAPDDSDMSSPEHRGRSRRRADPVAQGKRARAGRSTGGPGQVVEAVESSSGTSSGTESSGSEKPLADDGCPQAFARMRELRDKEKLQCRMPGTLPSEDSDSVKT